MSWENGREEDVVQARQKLKARSILLSEAVGCYLRKRLSLSPDIRLRAFP